MSNFPVPALETNVQSPNIGRDPEKTWRANGLARSWRAPTYAYVAQAQLRIEWGPRWSQKHRFSVVSLDSPRPEQMSIQSGPTSGTEPSSRSP